MRLKKNSAIPQSSASPVSPATTPPAIAPTFLVDLLGADFTSSLGEGLVEADEVAVDDMAGDEVAVDDMAEDKVLAAGVGKR
jgi:hypothetical protein